VVFDDSEINETSYSVSFEVAGGISVNTIDNIASGSNITLPSTSKSGCYTFDGWYTSSSGGTRIGGAGDSYTVNGNTTLYAYWTQNTISFAPNGGTPIIIISNTESNCTITLPSTSRSGYDFDGWYTSLSGGTRVGGAGDSYTVNGNITLYARWSQNSGGSEYYTISFDAAGGTPVSSINNMGSNFTITLPSTSRSGYDFDGWYTSLSGGTRVGGAGGSYVVNGNVTLYAHWEAVLEYIELLDDKYLDFIYGFGDGGNVSVESKNPLKFTITLPKLDIENNIVPWTDVSTYLSVETTGALEKVDMTYKSNNSFKIGILVQVVPFEQDGHLITGVTYGTTLPASSGYTTRILLLSDFIKPDYLDSYSGPANLSQVDASSINLGIYFFLKDYGTSVGIEVSSIKLYGLKL
jgi:uncharacterized repeat protein (TIGR02543 family)